MDYFVTPAYPQTTLFQPQAPKNPDQRPNPIISTPIRQAAPGCLHKRRISGNGIVFVLNKLAETVLPIRAQLSASTQPPHIARVCRTKGQCHHWYISGPNVDLDLDQVSYGWLIQRSSVYNEICTLEICSDCQQTVATIKESKAHQQVWHALLQWLLLRERVSPAVD